MLKISYRANSRGLLVLRMVVKSFSVSYTDGFPNGLGRAIDVSAGSIEAG